MSGPLPEILNGPDEGFAKAFAEWLAKQLPDSGIPGEHEFLVESAREVFLGFIHNWAKPPRGHNYSVLFDRIATALEGIRDILQAQADAAAKQGKIDPTWNETA